MTGKSATLIMEMGAELVRLFGYGARAECRMLPHGAIALSGEGSADLNMAVLTADATRAELDDTLAAAAAKGVDAILVVEEGADGVRGWAAEAGLTQVGQMPLMERPALPVEPGTRFTLRIADPSEGSTGNGLAAAAFDLNETMCNAAMPDAVYADTQLWLAEDRGEPVGSGVFVRTGEQVAIYCMATPPEQQRRGIGRAVLDAAIAHYQAEGVTRFNLGATEMGYPLYEKVGFEVVSRPHVYVIGTSTQFPGS